MSYVEIAGFVTGAACVGLAVKENVWNWPIGILNNIFFLVLFWNSKLYADAILQIVYVVIGLYGWWNWLYGGTNHAILAVSRISRPRLLSMLIFTIVGTILLRSILVAFTDSSVPTLDGFTTATSLVAQYMLGKKWIESWFFWIVADVIYVGLYLSKSLALTAILYGVFLLMCVAGWRQWSRSAEDDPSLISGGEVAG